MTGQLAHLVFEASNVAIVLGYMVLAFYLAPRLDVRYRRTMYGGSAFFVLCGLTHLGIVTASHNAGHGDDLWWVALHIAQAVAVWVFIHGLHYEYVNKDTRHDLLS